MGAIERLRERAQNEATCIELSRQNKLLRSRVARLEEALQKIADGCGMIPDKSTVYMSGKSPEVPKVFNVYDMREIASRALEEK